MKIFQGMFLASVVLLILASCQPPTGTVRGRESLKLISIEEAKAIVAKDIYETGFYNQYFILDSPNFDDRVRQVTWGEPLLVKGIPDGFLYKEDFYYYVLMGIMPDGRILASETVDAVTGKVLNGGVWMDKGADIIRLASVPEVKDYVNQRTGMPKDTMKISAVFYYTDYSIGLDVSWKYLVEKIDTSTGARGLETGDYVLVDPFVDKYDKDRSLRPDNTIIANITPHRLFKYASVPAGYRSRTVRSGEAGTALVPVD